MTRWSAEKCLIIILPLKGNSMGLISFLGDLLEDSSYEVGYNDGSDLSNSDTIFWHFNQNLLCRNYDNYKRGFECGRSEKEEKEESVRFEENKKNFALSCRRCGGYALPVRGTSRHYSCSCGNKFTGSKHNF